MYMASLAIFHTLILMGVGTDKFLIDLGVRNIFDTKFIWSGNMLVPGLQSVCFVALL